MKRIGVALAFVAFLTFPSAISANLIWNGDFEQGDCEFVTDYAYVSPPPDPRPDPSSPYYLSLDGQYTVYTDPNAVHSRFALYGDHTSGAGNMLIVNGASDRNSPDVYVVWQQTVPVTPNADYVLTYCLASCVSTSPAEIECTINGSVLGAELAPNVPGEWVEVSYLWNSGPSTEATITLEDLTRQPSGDDFSIDDISLWAVRLPVAVDIKPGSDTNPINLRSRGVVPVAILGSDSLDVRDIDQTTLLFAGAAPRARGRSGRIGSFEDVNDDGSTDLVARFPVEDLNLTEADSEATLTGQLSDGTPIEGTDSVRIVPSHR